MAHTRNGTLTQWHTQGATEEQTHSAILTKTACTYMRRCGVITRDTDGPRPRAVAEPDPWDEQHRAVELGIRLSCVTAHPTHPYVW